MKKVILISGHLQVGKNQFANYLTKELEAKKLKVSNDLFAKSLKDGCKDDFRKLSIVLEKISDEIKNKINLFFDLKFQMITPSIVNDFEKSINKLIIKDENWYENKNDITRNILQLYGTEIFRNRVDQDWWVNQVKNRAKASQDDVIIVTDCRFPNEIVGMYDDNYEIIVIRIERNINTNKHVSLHESETALDDWKEFDFIVENNKTLNDLKKSAKFISDYILSKTEEFYDGLFTRTNKKNLFNDNIK